MSIRTGILLGLLTLVAVSRAHAQLAADLARQHAARAGDRLAALHSLRTEGRIFIAGETMRFILVAERPDHLRVESFSRLRKAIQGYDGKSAPWISHTDTQTGTPRAMPKVDADDFIASADFDGPLVNYAQKGYSVDYAGEDSVEGKRAWKILLMSRQDEIFFLWIDAETLEVVKRVVYRNRDGKRVAIETLFKDFRPVAGVPQPFRIETSADGELLYAMVVDRMDANVPVAPGAFTQP